MNQTAPFSHLSKDFAVRPRWSTRYLDGIKTGRFDHDRLVVEAITQEHGRMLAFNLTPDMAAWSSWSHLHGPDALENFVEMANFFVLMPETVFAASSNNCCVCGRGLTDENSRCRGIGPECIQYVTDWMIIERIK